MTTASAAANPTVDRTPTVAVALGDLPVVLAAALLAALLALTLRRKKAVR